MSLEERVEAFARLQETRVREELKQKEQHINREIEKLLQVSDVSSSDQLLSIEPTREEIYCDIIHGISNIYKGLLNECVKAGNKIEERLRLDLKGSNLDESKPIEYYEDVVYNGYQNVMIQFNETCGTIMNFCNMLLNKESVIQLGQIGEAYVLVNLLVNFSLPIDKTIEVLEEALKQKSILESSTTNDNNDSSTGTAFVNLKKYTEQLIKIEYTINFERIKILESVENAFNLEQVFKKRVHELMTKHHDISLTGEIGKLQLDLCMNGLNGITESDTNSLMILSKCNTSFLELAADAKKLFDERLQHVTNVLAGRSCQSDGSLEGINPIH